MKSTQPSGENNHEVCEARDQRRATVIASRPGPNGWHLRIEGDPVADPMPDGLATGATLVDMEGPNVREHLAKRREEAAS